MAADSTADRTHLPFAYPACVPLWQVWGYGTNAGASETSIEQAYRVCLDRGVTLIDTAEVYGLGDPSLLHAYVHISFLAFPLLYQPPLCK